MTYSDLCADMISQRCIELAVSESAREIVEALLWNTGNVAAMMRKRDQDVLLDYVGSNEFNGWLREMMLRG